MIRNNIISDVIKSKKLDIIDFDNYGLEIAKILKIKPANYGKLVIVTSMSPTPVGEGKTTTSIGLVDGLNKLGIRTIGALREPSMGPVFGMKGTGSGGNKAILLPFDKINLHFTGDFHTITTANNLISAVIENEIYNNSQLNIDVNKILWKRCIDSNDRSLREIKYNIRDNISCVTSFNITAASDLMALFCLVNSKEDFAKKISNTIVAYSKTNKPITIANLEITDAILKIMEDAFAPNLVRTLENNPVIVHGGPFANIAHGCSSIISIKTAMQLADITITEAGFGSDLGLEKFMDITCVEGGFSPDLIVLAISLKSILYNGSYNGANYNENLTNHEKINNGFQNVLHHVEHCQKYQKPILIAINHRHNEDLDEDLQYLKELLKKHNIEFAINDCWAQGSDGAIELSEKAISLLDNISTPHVSLYNQNDSLMTKITNISTNAYGASGVIFSELAKKQLEELKPFSDYYVCISKNPYSLTCDQKILGRPKNYNTTIEHIEINHAAKMIIPITSIVYRMPGLPRFPKAKNFILK